MPEIGGRKAMLADMKQRKEQDATNRALIEIGSSMKQQIGLLAISDGFVLIALCAAFCLLILSLLVYAPPLVLPQKRAPKTNDYVWLLLCPLANAAT